MGLEVGAGLRMLGRGLEERCKVDRRGRKKLMGCLFTLLERELSELG